MAAFYMGAAVAAAGRRVAYFKEMTKLLETQIDQVLVPVQNGEIDIPAVYKLTCLTLGRTIETAIAMNAVPSPSHLPRLLQIVKEVYIRKAELTDSSLKMLLEHIKSACQAGWFSNEDKDRLLMMVDKTSLEYYNLDIWNVEPTNEDYVSEIISRFYPRMRVEHILASVDVKAGDKGSEAYFDISPNTVPQQNLWLLVARTDDMDTAACLTSPSNVDFLINNSEVPNRTRKKMGKGPQLPTNVTKMVKDGVNRLQAIGEFDGDYVIALAIMSLISSPDPSRLQDYVYPVSNDVESDCFVANGQSRILLDCPISGRRIRTPVKGQFCKHSQCFDYDYFMDANFMRPLWKCPLAHCNQPICNLDIRIDQTFLKILNEVADNVGDVYMSDDGSWTVSLTEKSQINKDTINQQNHVPDDTEILVSLGANETPPMSSSAFNGIGGPAMNMTVECPSTIEQQNVTTPAVSLEANETPPVSSSDFHSIDGPAINMTVECSSTFEQPNVAAAAVSLEANETPPVSSSALHNVGGSTINMTVKCPSTFEQPTVTTPAVFPPQVVKDSPLMSQSSCNMVHSPPLAQLTRPNPNPTATRAPEQAQQQNSQTKTSQPTEEDNYNHTIQSSSDMVHAPALVQQTRPNPNPTASQLPAQTQPQNSPAQTDQPTEANNGTCTSNQARRTSNRARRTTVFTPVHLTPPSAAAPVLRKLERQPRGTTGEVQGTTLVPPAIKKRGRKRKIPTIPVVGTEAQGTTLVTPVIKKRGLKPKITTDPAVGLNQVPEVSRDEMSSVGMRGGLRGEKREAALLERLAPPRQPIDADKPWPGPTTTIPLELMKQLNISHPSALAQ